MENAKLKDIPEAERKIKEAIKEFESNISGQNLGSFQVVNSPSDVSFKGANQAKKKSVLGRGLNALMSGISVPVEIPGNENSVQEKQKAVTRFIDSETSQTKNYSEILLNEEEVEGSLAYLPLDRVIPNPEQPRKHFSQVEIDSLAKSIKETGLLQPIVVRRVNREAGAQTKYEIVAGERRFRACQIAGLKTISAQVKKLSDTEALELGIIENIQREDLNPIEEAQAFQRLINIHGKTQEEVARLSGRDRSSIANSLRLLKLPNEVKDLLITKQLSAGHARAVLSVETEEAQISLAKKILEDGLTVRDAEVESKNVSLKNITKIASNKNFTTECSPHVRALEERFRRALGTKVSLIMTTHDKQGSSENKGELRIKFFSKAELENLLEKLSA